MKTGKASGGVVRLHARSSIQKRTFWGLHSLIILVCIWLVFFNGLPNLGSVFGQNWTFSDPLRTRLLFGCALLYWLRHGITLFYLLTRMVEWKEVFGLISFIALFDIGLLLIGGAVFRDKPIFISWIDGIALLLLLCGSYLNSFSEIQRKWWKKKPSSKGHCYTGGLFKYALHINYFGDVVLFTGWSLLTHNIWTLALPIFMLFSFVFMHIPGLDAYLKTRYGAEFETYAATTKKLVPYIY